MTSITPDLLRELARRIIASGVLGRSKTYAAILDYLVECSIRGEHPKEMAIAVDVLGRDAEFDVGKDSIVRVHLYHLRNKLQTYFDNQGAQERWRLEIPKGQYLLVAVSNAALQETGTEKHAGKTARRQAVPGLLWVSGVLAVLLVIALFTPPLHALKPSALDEARAIGPWQNIMDDDAQVLLVVGDYFIFGELDDRGNVARMVRDFSVNSADDLNAIMVMQPDLYDRYYNLGLSYLPVGSASALSSLMPLLYDQGHRVSVRTMSQLNASDLTENHIIYVGYLSGLGVLEDLMFAASDFRVGTTYDELIASDGAEYVTSSGILNTQDEFHDYGLVSAFTSPRGHQFLLVAGMRDAALISMAREMATAEGLAQVLGMADDTARSADDGLSAAWEGLYEVYGYDHTSFDARLIQAESLNANLIWGGE